MNSKLHTHVKQAVIFLPWLVQVMIKILMLSMADLAKDGLARVATVKEWEI